MSRRLISQAISFAIGFSPIAARASDVLYICQDVQNPSSVEYVTINLDQKKVVVESGRYPARCMLTFRNGADSPVLSVRPGESCMYIDLNGGTAPKVRQTVKINGNMVAWGGTNDSDNTQSAGESLNLDTGVLETGVGPEECHRPHS